MAEAATQIVPTIEYQIDAAGIDKLGEHHNIKAINSKKDYDLVRRGIACFVKVRSQIEAARKGKKRAVLDAGIAIDGLANALKDNALKYEDRLRAMKAEVDEVEAKKQAALDKAEEDRVAKIDEHIEDIRSIPAGAEDKDAATLQKYIDDTESMILTEQMFQEKLEEAEARRADVLDALNVMYDKQVNKEEQARALEQQRQDQEAEAKRLREAREKLEADQADAAAQQKAAREKADADRRKEQAEVDAKRKAEEDRLAAERAEVEADRRKLEADKQAAIQKELDESNARVQAENDRRAAEQAEADRKWAAEQTAKAEAALAPDKQKMGAFADALFEAVDTVSRPEIKDPRLDKAAGDRLNDILKTIDLIRNASK